MFKNKLLPFAVVPLLWVSVAFAQSGPGAMGSGPGTGMMGSGAMTNAVTPAERAERHKDMCSQRYGRQVGRIAALETRLGLTDQQRPAWNAWAKGVGSSETALRDQCLSDQPRGDTPPTALEHEARMERGLSAHLQALQANRPAMQTLYDVLTPDQKKIFDRFLSPHGRHGRGGMGGGMGMPG